MIFLFFFHRHVWRKYRNRRDSSSGLPWYRSVYSRDNTAESLHHRPHSGGTTIQSATRILSAQDVSTLTRCLAFRQFYLLRGCVIFEGEGEDGQGLGQWTRGCRWRDAVSLTRKCSEIDRLDRGSIDRFGWLAQLADANFDVVRWINKTA